MAGSEEPGTEPGAGAPDKKESAERGARRARLLAELAEARALRERVFPRRTRKARRRAEQRARTFLRG